jgi:hypothetical protein
LTYRRRASRRRGTKARTRRTRLRFRWYNPDEVVEGKTMKDHFRFSVVYWHTFRGTGSTRSGRDHAAAVGRRHRLGENAQNRARVALNSSRNWERRSTPFTTGTWRPRARRWPNRTRTSTPWSGAERGTTADGHQAAVGDGQPVQQSALHARRGDQLQRRRVRLRRGPGEEVPGGDQGIGRRQLCVLGRREGYQNCSTPT